MSEGWLIYHPPRQRSVIGRLTVYHDRTSGNQDPYIWNESFLHTVCHITQMSPHEGDVSFWVSGDTFPDFTQLFCDLVFVVRDKCFWTERNEIAPGDCIVDSWEAYADHYYWCPRQHHYKRRRRFTLKADPSKSFQPQTSDAQLLDVVPVLDSLGLDLDRLRDGLVAAVGSRPMRIAEEVASAIYEYLDTAAPIHLTGYQLQEIRQTNPQMASPGVSFVPFLPFPSDL